MIRSVKATSSSFTLLLPLGSTLAPGLGVWQATHSTSAALFCTRHTSQSQEPSGFLNASPNPKTGALLTGVEASAAASVDAPVSEMIENKWEYHLLTHSFDNTKMSRYLV